MHHAPHSMHTLDDSSLESFPSESMVTEDTGIEETETDDAGTDETGVVMQDAVEGTTDRGLLKVCEG